MRDAPGDRNILIKAGVAFKNFENPKNRDYQSAVEKPKNAEKRHTNRETETHENYQA